MDNQSKEQSEICKKIEGNYTAEEIEEYMHFAEMFEGFKKDAMWLTKPNHKHTWWNNVKDVFTVAKKFDPEVLEFCEDKIDKIFDYVVGKNLKPEDFSWRVLGHFMWKILYHPEEIETLPLPKELVNFALEQFEGRKITLKKVNGAYTVVFDE